MLKSRSPIAAIFSFSLRYLCINLLFLCINQSFSCIGQNCMSLLKKVFIIQLLVISSIASAKTFYVSKTGNDRNPGTLSAPWLTWHYAFNHTPSGDTCYFRGGVYQAYSTSIGASLNSSAFDGTYSHPTCFFNYPGEVPVLDCFKVATSPNQIGISISVCSNIYFKGLTVKNVRQLPGGLPSYGWLLWNHGSAHDYAPNNIRFENCTVHNIGGTGFCCAGVDTVRFINCDAYVICDSLSTYDPGGFGTGFDIFDGGYLDGTKSYVYYYGCRAWKCSDQGYSNSFPGAIVYDHCWAINNGNFVYPGNIYQKGSGWKWAWHTEKIIQNPLVVKVTIQNCIAVDNEYRGFNCADDYGTKYELRAHIYNNFAYRNGKLHPEGNISGFGFYDYINTDTIGRWDHWYCNNVSYDNAGGASGETQNGDYIPGAYHKSNNFFDVAGSPVTNSFFLSLDTTGLCGQRQADGSQPLTNFGKPAPGSPLIDAGINVGLPFYGNAPDVGAYEYLTAGPGFKPVTRITITSESGASSIITDHGTLQLRASVLPVDATNKTVTWSISNGSDKAAISSTGLVSAIDNGTVIARATANDGSGVYGTLAITISNQVNANNINTPPAIVINYNPRSYSGFVGEINASGSYDIDKDGLTYTWITPNNIAVSSTSASTIKYLSPIINSPQTFEFLLKISDGKVTESKTISIEILPYRPELEEAEILSVEASSFQPPYYPLNAIDGDLGSMWSAEGDNQWLLLKLKQPFFLQHMKIAFQPWQIEESFFDILASKDGIIWESILVKTASCGFSGDFQVFNFPPSKTGKEINYVKLVGRCNSADAWNYISELKIFGYKYLKPTDYENLPVKIYPNPAKELITLRIDGANIVTDVIQIADLSGKVILKTEIDPDVKEFTIPLNLRNGIYIIKLALGELPKYTQKLIVSK